MAGRVKRPDSVSVQESVYTALRRNIININLPPGTAISEKEIAEHYSVSRTPVRESFIRLFKEALIHVVPQKETVVSLIDFKRVEQERFLRESLEIAVIDDFLRNAKPQELKRLKAIIEKQVKSAENNEYTKFLEYDDIFHEEIFRVAGREFSWEHIKNITGHYFRVRLLTMYIEGITTSKVKQHEEIAMALENNNGEKAKDILKYHLREINIEESRLKEEFPDYFAKEEEENPFDVDFNISLKP